MVCPRLFSLICYRPSDGCLKPLMAVYYFGRSVTGVAGTLVRSGFLVVSQEFLDVGIDSNVMFQNLFDHDPIAVLAV